MCGVAQPMASPFFQVRKLGLGPHRDEMVISAPEIKCLACSLGLAEQRGPGEPGARDGNSEVLQLRWVWACALVPGGPILVPVLIGHVTLDESL